MNTKNCRSCRYFAVYRIAPYTLRKQAGCLHISNLLKKIDTDVVNGVKEYHVLKEDTRIKNEDFKCPYYKELLLGFIRTPHPHIEMPHLSNSECAGFDEY